MSAAALVAIGSCNASTAIGCVKSSIASGVSDMACGIAALFCVACAASIIARIAARCPTAARKRSSVAAPGGLFLRRGTVATSGGLALRFCNEDITPPHRLFGVCAGQLIWFAAQIPLLDQLHVCAVKLYRFLV